MSEEKKLTSEASSVERSCPDQGSMPAGCAGKGSRVEFPEAEFYACNDPETLTHTTPEEAIEEYLDSVASPGCDMAALIREWTPVTVYAYEPMKVSATEMETWADDLLEQLGEKFGGDYTDPDSDPFDAFPSDATATMREAVAKIIKAARVWSCESVGKVTLSAEQTEAIVRDSRPDWFREPTPSQTASETLVGEGRDGDGSPCETKASPPVAPPSGTPRASEESR